MLPNPDPPCPFCTPDGLDPVATNGHAMAIRDGFPVSPGHTLIIPRRHVASFFDLAPSERIAMLELTETCRHDLISSHHPSAFNVGINDGPDAGQTVMHCHLHLIPRYDGDVGDPRGGIRWVIPAKAPYWDQDSHG